MSYFKNKTLDPIWDNPDILKANSAKKVQEISEKLSNFQHPINITNQKLSNIEGHSATRNNLLLKAAESNEKTSKTALKISVFAILIAVLMPVVQIGYNELWRVPQETESAKTMINSLKKEIEALREQLKNN